MSDEQTITMSPPPKISAKKATRLSSPHYVLNVRLLVITLGMLGVMLPVAYLFYKHQLRQTSNALLARAAQLQKEKDWSQASAYYQRYLLLVPEDTQALVQLVEAVAKQVPTPAGRTRLNDLIYRTLGRVPERHDLRRILAENLLQLGAFEEAEKEAGWLIADRGDGVENAPEEARSARKILALSQASRARAGDGVSINDAVKALQSAAAESPGDVELVEVTANTLRLHPTSIEVANTTSATVADQLMNQLVATDPKNVQALLARYKYRTQYKLADAASDLETALEIEPNNLDAVLLSALSAMGKSPDAKQQANAELLLRRAIEIAPSDPRAYLVLASVLERSDKLDDAVKLLQSGRRATLEHFEVVVACANSQIIANDLAGAQKTLHSLESQTPSYLVQLNGDARTQVVNRLRLLRAQLELANGDSRSAVPRLHAIRLETEAKAGHQQSPEWRQASKLLADIHARAGQWDKASEYWATLAKAFPGDAFIVRQTVDAQLKAANPNAAIATIDDFIRLREPSPELLVQRVQAQLALQLSRPDADRNWTEFNTALKAAKSVAADSARLVFAEVAYLASDSGQQAAATLLRGSENKHPDDVAFWRIAAQMYQELGAPSDVQRALAKHRGLARSAADHAVLEASLLASDGKHKQADELLAALDQPLSTDERQRIERLRIEVMAASNNLAGAFQRVQRLIEVDAKDVGLLSIGIEVALGAGELKAAEAWEREFRELTDDSSQVGLLRARRLLLSFQQLPAEEKKELGRSIIELRTERPAWYPAVALAAQYAQLQGDLRQAMTDYGLAVELGDRRPATLQQLITLLYKEGRFEEAQKYLSYRTANSKLFDPFFDTMAVELAVKQERSAEALEIARKSVERFPDDAMRRITLANLLIRYGQTQEGIKVLREAARSFKDDSRVWLGLFSALVQTGQTDDARRTLAALVKSSFLPPQQRYLVAAQGHELLGESEAAEKLYKMAIAQDPEQLSVRLKYAKLLSRTDPKAARSEYERVLQQEPANGEARRDLATLLAATRQEADWKRITDLLATTGGDSTSDAITNDRLRAMLLSQKGRSRKERVANCQTARGILQKLIETETAGADNLTHLLIARILEQEAELSDDPSLLLAARDQLRLVVDRAPSTLEKQSLFIEFLLRHGVPPATDSLENVASKEPRSDIARQAEEFLSEAETRLGDLRQLESSGGNERKLLTVSFQARLMNARGREDDAKALIADYAAGQTQQDQKDNNKAEQYLTIGRLYSSIGAHAEAEKWYRRLTKLTPNGYVLVAQSLMAQNKRKEAVEFCLSVSDGKPTPEMAALLASVMTATEEPVTELPDVQAAIKATMDDHKENIELLQAEAVRRASLGQYEDSITLFRRILAINPDHVLTLNNLATMLAERPNQRAEALEHIQRAIEIGGRQAALLDTQGTILFKIGETEQAIDCLEEATAGEATDARYYLHLAAAYHQAQREDDARRILAEARAVGLGKFVLTGDDRKMLVTLDKLLSQVPGTP